MPSLVGKTSKNVKMHQQVPRLDRSPSDLSARGIRDGKRPMVEADERSLAQEASLIPAARRAKALELVRRHGAISIQRLADEIKTSISTARRDVDYLSAAGYLERSHGGALLSVRSRTTFEPATDIADQVARPAKIAIGRCAANMVEDGQS